MKSHVATNRRGFTIIELLTVMAVIAILMALFVPALNLVKDSAKAMTQKAQLRAIDAGLEMFKNEFGSYPASNDNSRPPEHLINNTPYCGANKLAEAMVGLDLLGFHPNSDFRANGTFSHDDGTGTNTLLHNAPVYHADANYDAANDTFDETRTENMQARTMFLDLENANAYRMQDVYDPANLATLGFLDTSVVLCDVYYQRRPSLKKTGMPILYYRARTNFMLQNYNDALVIADDIYYYPDNENLLMLGLPEDINIKCPLADENGSDDTPDLEDFENAILNMQVLETSNIRRPYRASSYILISAGKDGLYGTADDITNFGAKE